MGCGGEDDKKLKFTSGTYAQSDANEIQDQCNVFDEGEENSATINVVVDADTVTIEGIEMPRDGKQFGGYAEQDYDWSPDFVCVERDRVEFDGTLVDDNEFEVEITLTWTPVSGTECSLANGGIPMPCTSRLSVTATKQ